ncbi:hypothetical protein HGRIS_003632 [Hohenbuehelia grisea]|uniref:Uncharacterized protein n=1 Tax=Hohenbuehelia grisea TaxID=104357 RepID=A0ABR3JH55_9AGAR
MPAVLSKPSILALSEASATVAESGAHHIEVVIVVVVIAGFTIVFLACRAIIAYQARGNDGTETSEVLAIQDVEKATDAEKHLDIRPFVFVPADMVDSPQPTAPSDTSSEAGSVPLITAFLSPMQFDDDDDEVEEESVQTLATIDTMDETVPERSTFAEKAVKVCEATEEAMVTECSAVVEEWPTKDDSVTVVNPPSAIEPCDNPASIAASHTFSEAASVPLITAFLSPIQLEEESDYPLPSGSLSTPSTPNFLNFWMQPDSAFFSAGAATDRAVTIDAKVYILGETVPKRRTFAEKELKICEVTNEADEATVEACSVVVEEWPVDDEPELGATPPRVIEPSTPIESVPTVIAIPTAKKSSTPFARKPLGTLKPNLPSFRASLSKISKVTTTSKTPTTNVSTSTKVGTLHVL